MELKKSKKANLEKKKHSIFLFSLVVASGFILTAFEWATYEVDYSLKKTEVGELIEEEPVIQDIEIIRKKIVQPKARQEIIDTFVIDNKIKDKEIALVVDTSVTDPVLTPTDSTPIVLIRKIRKPVNTIFDRVEEMPSYKGGEQALFQYLGGKAKYTRRAKEEGAEGTVYIEFVVEKDGSISNTKIARGIHPDLDRISLDAVKNMRHWNPGKQREQPVRVKFILPFKYQLR